MHAKDLLKIVLALALVGSPLLLSGCNTLSGMGEDVEAAGSAIDKSAEENKPY